MRVHSRLRVFIFYFSLRIHGPALASPRGVAHSRNELYDPSRSPTFTCDGGKTVPYSRVNDDYCDCVDGSDEPGTAACAHLTLDSSASEFRGFYCTNVGHRGKYCPPSIVDDSVCDCCDGSDEAADACPNTCERVAAASHAANSARIARLEEGARIKADYVAKGRAAAEARAGRIEELDTALQDLDGKCKALEEEEALLSEKQKALRDAKQREADGITSLQFPGIEAMGVQELRSLLVRYARKVDKNGRALMRLLTGASDDDDESGDDDYTHHYGGDIDDEYGDYDSSGSSDDYYDSMHDEYHDLEDEENIPYDAADADDGLNEDEYRGMMDEYGSDGYEDEDYAADYTSATRTTEAPGDAEAAASGDARSDGDVEMVLDEDDIDFGDGSGGSVDGNKGSEYTSGDRSEEDFLADSVVALEDPEDLKSKRKELETLREEKRKLDKEIRNARSDADSYFGIDQEFFLMKGQCFSLKHQQYTYEICPYGSAHQREGSAKHGGFSLGKWTGIVDVEADEDGTTKAFKFEDGTYCNGPARSALVSLRCGTTNELIEVDEPEMCQYTMVLSTPAACSLSSAGGPLNFDGFDDVAMEQVDVEGEL